MIFFDDMQMHDFKRQRERNLCRSIKMVKIVVQSKAISYTCLCVWNFLFISKKKMIKQLPLPTSFSNNTIKMDTKIILLNNYLEPYYNNVQNNLLIKVFRSNKLENRDFDDDIDIFFNMGDDNS